MWVFVRGNGELEDLGEFEAHRQTLQTLVSGVSLVAGQSYISQIWESNGDVCFRLYRLSRIEIEAANIDGTTGKAYTS